MGEPKPGATLGDQTLLGRACEIVRRAGLEPVVVTKAPEGLPDVGAPVLSEPERVHHPLAGIAAALLEIGAPVVSCPCDMPHLPPGLLADLARRPETLAVVRYAGRAEPLLARWTPPLLEAVAAARDAGEPASALVERLSPVWIEDERLERFGSPNRFLANVNTPEQLRRARPGPDR